MDADFSTTQDLENIQRLSFGDADLAMVLVM
jgi:hypothetical protein